MEALLVRLTSQLSELNAWLLDSQSGQITYFVPWIKVDIIAPQNLSLLTVATAVVASQRKVYVYFSLVDSQVENTREKRIPPFKRNETREYKNPYILVSRFF